MVIVDNLFNALFSYYWTLYLSVFQEDSMRINGESFSVIIMLTPGGWMAL